MNFITNGIGVHRLSLLTILRDLMFGPYYMSIEAQSLIDKDVLVRLAVTVSFYWCVAATFFALPTYGTWAALAIVLIDVVPQLFQLIRSNNAS